MKRRKKYDILLAQVLSAYIINYIKSLIEDLKYFE